MPDSDTTVPFHAEPELGTGDRAAEIGEAEAALRQSGRRLLYSSEHNAQIRIWEFG